MHVRRRTAGHAGVSVHACAHAMFGRPDVYSSRVGVIFGDAMHGQAAIAVEACCGECMHIDASAAGVCAPAQVHRCTARPRAWAHVWRSARRAAAAGRGRVGGFAAGQGVRSAQLRCHHPPEVSMTNDVAAPVRTLWGRRLITRPGSDAALGYTGVKPLHPVAARCVPSAEFGVAARRFNRAGLRCTQPTKARRPPV